MRFIIAGNISKLKDELLARIESIELVKGDNRIDLPSETLITTTTPIVYKKTDVENVYYRYEVNLGPLLNTKEIDALQTLNGLLFGSMHSRVFGKAREQGLVYGIGYGDYRTRDNSLFWVGGQVLPENLETLLTLFVRELRDISSGNVSEEELETIRMSALGTFKRSTQTVGQLIDGYLPWFIFEDKIENYFDMPNRIKSVTVDAVVDAARRIDAHIVYGIGFAGATRGINPAQLVKTLTE
jgi:hypothetical protein